MSAARAFSAIRPLCHRGAAGFRTQRAALDFPRPPKKAKPSAAVLRTEGLDVGREQINNIFVTPGTRLLLILTMMYSPKNIPERIRPGTLNSAWGRARLFVATVACFAVPYVADKAIHRGKDIRDAGEESIYHDPAASEQRRQRRERLRLEQQQQQQQQQPQQ